MVSHHCHCLPIFEWWMQVAVVASVMQQMEEERISPDAVSYQFILKSLLDARQFDKAAAIFSHMVSRNVVPTSHTLRMYARAMTGAGRKKESDAALERLVALEGSVPTYLAERLVQLEQQAAAGGEQTAEKAERKEKKQQL